MNSVSTVAYPLLFATTAFVFIFASLLLGRFLRPKLPVAAKHEIYECGEPTIGSSFVQFDLRFYVVALVFIVFEVEAAFFFPWAVVFGTATRLSDARVPKVALTAGPSVSTTNLSPAVAAGLRDLGVTDPGLPRPAATAEENAQRVQAGLGTLSLMALADVALFFAVLLVGFAYVWRQGDLNWVRAMDPITPAIRAAESPSQFTPAG
jgi:NADH-quinone oxidoreductase subunit A